MKGLYAWQVCDIMHTLRRTWHVVQAYRLYRDTRGCAE
jgi:hypothetical protein